MYCNVYKFKLYTLDYEIYPDYNVFKTWKRSTLPCKIILKKVYCPRWCNSGGLFTFISNMGGLLTGFSFMGSCASLLIYIMRCLFAFPNSLPMIDSTNTIFHILLSIILFLSNYRFKKLLIDSTNTIFHRLLSIVLFLSKYRFKKLQI